MVGFNALTLAVQFNHPLIVAYLLSRGVSADVTDLEGRSPLMWSVAKHFHEVTRLLLGMRASANMADGAGETLYCLLLVWLQLTCLFALGNTALHWACRMTNMSSARVLVEQHHADMHAINSKGESPLQIALKLDKGLHTYVHVHSQYILVFSIALGVVFFVLLFLFFTPLFFLHSIFLFLPLHHFASFFLFRSHSQFR